MLSLTDAFLIVIFSVYLLMSIQEILCFLTDLLIQRWMTTLTIELDQMPQDGKENYIFKSEGQKLPLAK